MESTIYRQHLAHFARHMLWHTRFLRKDNRMILSISAKCGDLFSAALTHDDGTTITDYSGPPPHYMQEVFIVGTSRSSWLSLDIDATTGQIIGWTPITEKDIS